MKVLTIIICLILASCKDDLLAYSTSKTWLIPESERVHIDILENKRGCVSQSNEDDRLGPMEGVILEYNGRIISAFELRHSKEKYEKDFKSLSFFRKKCQPNEIQDIKKVGKYIYSIDINREVLKNIKIDFIKYITSSSKKDKVRDTAQPMARAIRIVTDRLGLSEKIIKKQMEQHNKEFIYERLGVSIESLMKENNLQLKMVFSKYNVAEIVIYSPIKRKQIGNSLLLSYYVHKNERGRNEVNFSSNFCSYFTTETTKEYRDFSTNNSKTIWYEIPNCEINKENINTLFSFMPEQINKWEDEISTAREEKGGLIWELLNMMLYQTHYGHFGFRIKSAPPAIPKIKTIPFGELLNPDLSPEIVKKYSDF